MSKWLPIETAPKDGERVLLYIPGFLGDKVWTGLYAEGWVTTCGTLNADEQPTHWMPIPRGPHGF